MKGALLVSFAIKGGEAIIAGDELVCTAGEREQELIGASQVRFANPSDLCN